MKFEEEYWVLTKEDAINYAKTLVSNSECERIMNSNKPSYNFEVCIRHAKIQLKRNLSMSEKERKIAYLKKLIIKMHTRYHTDEIVREAFPKIEQWFDYLGKECRLNPIFKAENYEMLMKISGVSINPPRVLF